MDLYGCHAPGGKDFQNQQWTLLVAPAIDAATDTAVGATHDDAADAASAGAVASSWRTIESRSAPGMCVAATPMTPNDCGTALWFPHDNDGDDNGGRDGDYNGSGDHEAGVASSVSYSSPSAPSSASTSTSTSTSTPTSASASMADVLSKAASPAAQSSGRAYAVATFGELRGGNLSLVSSADLISWTNEGVFLSTRYGMWDNATLSSGPSPMRLKDGNWLILYNVDNLWPVSNPAPLPAFGRCALGWAIVDARNLTNVLARADAPLVFAGKRGTAADQDRQ